MKRAAVLLLSVIAFPLTLHAESSTAPSAAADSAGEGWSLEGGIGFTAGPDSFLMQIGAPYQLGQHFALGPAFQIGVSDSTTIVAPTLDARLGFDLSSLENPYAKKIEPFVSGGLGIAYIDRDLSRGRHREGTDFLLHMGFGAEYRFSDEISFRSGMRFSVIPGRAGGEKFYYSWQMAGIRYRF